MSPGFKRYLLGIAIGLIALVGLLLAAEVFPLAGLIAFPVLLGLLLWSEGWALRGLGVVALVILIAFVVHRVAG